MAVIIELLARIPTLMSEGDLGKAAKNMGEAKESRDLVARRSLPFGLGTSENDRIALHVVYGLYGAAVVFGIPSFFGVVLAYLKRQDVLGTPLESHVVWQIRTFWIWLISVIIAAGLAATWVLIPLSWLIGGPMWLWFVYRTVKGWIKLSNDEPIAAPYAFF